MLNKVEFKFLKVVETRTKEVGSNSTREKYEKVNIIVKMTIYI